MPTLADLVKNQDFLGASEQAKALVFDRVSHQDETFLNASPEAQKIVRSRILGTSTSPRQQQATVESETLQQPDVLIPGFYGAGRVTLDPVDFVTGFGSGGLGAGLAKQGLKRVATEAIRAGVGFQTGGLSEVPTLIKNIPTAIRNFIIGRGKVQPKVVDVNATQQATENLAARAAAELRPSVRTIGEQRYIKGPKGQRIPTLGLRPGTQIKIPRQDAPPYVSSYLPGKNTSTPLPEQFYKWKPGIEKEGPLSPYDGRAIFDPQTNPAVPPPITYWERVKAFLTKQRQKLPSELRVLKEAPQSPVMRSVDRMTADVTSGAETLVKLPWAQALLKYSPEQFAQLETRAVGIWEQGGRTASALDQAIAAMPPDIQAMLRYRQSRLPIEQAARSQLGLSEIPETPGPYFARLSEQGLQDIKAISGGKGRLPSELQATIKSFQQARTFRTMAEGQRQGMVYVDPRTAWAMREWHSLKLEATAKLMQELEAGKVLFRTPELARAGSPIKQVFGIEGLPGTQQWYTGTNAEREFLIQNLSRADRGALSSAISLGNQLFRNPNLFNPLPHFTKNMLYKYGLSRGNPAQVFPDMLEYERASSPLVSQFKAVFPAADTAKSAGQLFDPFLNPTGITHKALRTLAKINNPSSTAIFAHLDPALRYARWKQYVGRGLSPQEAANHVQVDLIRYGTRSDAVDFWKSIPLNFFVPWRTGTMTSVVKQVLSHPIRAAAFIGAIDYLREARYRQSGRWTHLPIDYLESPVSQVISHPTPKTIGAIGATTLLFGPGGATTASTLRDAIEDIRGGDEWGRVRNMFWGLSQIYEVPTQWQAFQKDGDVSHLVNILTSAATAEHSAINYAPRRLAAYLPEWLPFMEKSELIKQAEAIQAQRKAKGEAMRARKAMHPRKSIEELLQVAP